MDDALDDHILRILEAANALETDGDRLRSKVPVASLDRELFLHSAYPTDACDAVFFGPDTYRFVAFVRQHLHLLRQCDHVVDMGTGTGAGGILVAKWVNPRRVSVVDTNAAGLRMAAINSAAAGVSIEVVESDAIPNANAVIANPPYIMDPASRAYRDGGELFGGAVALDWEKQGLQRLGPGGTALLYKGAA